MQMSTFCINFQHFFPKPRPLQKLIRFSDDLGHFPCEKEEASVYKKLHPHLSLPHPGVLRHTYEGEVKMAKSQMTQFPMKSIFQLLSFSVPKPASNRGLPHNWLNRWSSTYHLLPRHAWVESQRSPGEFILSTKILSADDNDRWQMTNDKWQWRQWW